MLKNVNSFLSGRILNGVKCLSYHTSKACPVTLSCKVVSNIEYVKVGLSRRFMFFIKTDLTSGLRTSAVNLYSFNRSLNSFEKPIDCGEEIQSAKLDVYNLDVEESLFYGVFNVFVNSEKVYDVERTFKLPTEISDFTAFLNEEEKGLLNSSRLVLKAPF